MVTLDEYIIDRDRGLLYKYTEDRFGVRRIVEGTEIPLKSKLPEKMSDLLELALKDLVSCDRDGLIICMNVWLHKANDVCYVCLAGAVMYQTLHMRPEERQSLLASDADNRYDYYKFLALDFLRIGDLENALIALQIPRPEELPTYLYVRPYGQGFMEDMNTILHQLREHDL